MAPATAINKQPKKTQSSSLVAIKSSTVIVIGEPADAANTARHILNSATSSLMNLLTYA